MEHAGSHLPGEPHSKKAGVINRETKQQDGNQQHEMLRPPRKLVAPIKKFLSMNMMKARLGSIY